MKKWNLTIENDVPMPSTRSSKHEEKQQIRSIFHQMKEGQSVFVEHDMLGHETLRAVTKEDEFSSYKFIMRIQDEPVRGARVWVKKIFENGKG